MTNTRYCRHHPRVRAGWSCPACHADLCADCVATQALGHRQVPLDLCCRCRSGVAALTVHRSQAMPFWQRVLDAPKFPLGGTGLLSLAVLGFVRALTSYVGLSSMVMMGAGVFLLRQGLFWAAIFFIIRSSAEGAAKMGVLGLRDIQSDVVAPAIKGLIATALVWLPAALYIVVVSDGGVLGILSYEGYKDPVVWLLGAIGICYAPMALLAGATDLGFAHILNPVHIFSFIKRMGRDYFTAVLAVALALVCGRLVEHVLASALAGVALPFVPRLIVAIVSLYAPFVAARVLGVLLFVHGEVLDWGRSEDYAVALLPGVRPRGSLPERQEPREPPPPPKAPRARAELGLETAEIPLALAHETPPPENPVAADVPAEVPAESPLAPLLRAVAENKMEEALRLYRELASRDTAIPPAVQMQIGKAASKAGDFEVAVEAFRQVAFGESAQAGAALVAMAQVIGEGQNDAAWAKKLYRQAIDRFPQSEVAAFAQSRLSAMGG